MNSLTEIKAKIKDFILKTSYLPEDQIQDHTQLFIQGIMDSMGLVSLIDFITESFNIETADNELLDSNFESINAIAGFIQEKLKTETVSSQDS